MQDSETSIQSIKEEVLAFAQEREWLQFHSPKNLCMALAAESGELMEHFLWADSEASHETLKDLSKKAEIEKELADIVIYSLQFANVAGIDLAKAIQSKMAENAKKYPVEKAKGNSAKYNEY